MKRFFRGAGVLLACVALAGCSLPRGAGFEAEVLSATTTVGPDGTPVPADFSVEQVTRDNLARYEAWPSPGPQPLNWITRQPQPANRIVAPGDRVAITVWDTEENSLLTAPNQRFVSLGEMTVSSSGSIFLPYVENVRIAGMSPDRAREALQERFAAIIPSAQVQLEMREGRQNTVSLVGGVAAPGSYPMPDRDFTVMALLAEAGGVRTGLVNPQVRLVRGDTLYGVSVRRLFSEPRLDTTLIGGDKVLVEEETRTFLSLGATGREAVHLFTRDELSALEAMAIVGGLQDTRANPQAILVLREYPASALRSDGTGPSQSRTIFTLDLTTADGLFSAGRFRIQPGDLVYATESMVPAIQSLLGFLGAGFGVRNQIER